MSKIERVESSGFYEAMRLVGDKWSLRILWAVMHGTTRFDVLQMDLGIARNILSDRLSRLIDANVLAKRPIRPMARRMEYRLTPRGEALRPALKLIKAWGGRSHLSTSMMAREKPQITGSQIAR